MNVLSREKQIEVIAALTEQAKGAAISVREGPLNENLYFPGKAGRGWALQGYNAGSSGVHKLGLYRRGGTQEYP